MFASEFADMLSQTIIWEPLASRDKYGKPVYGAAQTFAPPTGGRRTSIT